MMVGQKQLVILACLCGVVLSLCGCLHREGEIVKTAGIMKLTEESAIERALQTIGLSGNQVRTSASQVALSEQALPFIEPSATSDVWRIDIDNVTITVEDRTQTVRNPYVKSLSVFLSSQTGQVLKVVSPAPEGDPSIYPFPSVQEQERQMRQGFEVFTGLPRTAPRITLMGALQKAVGGAHNAKQIIAYYVVKKDRAIWAVHLWGIPPFLPIGGSPESVAVAARNHLRSIIDAETGQVYKADTIPQPVDR